MLLIVNALGMDIELRPRNWTSTGADPLDPATSVADIGLSPEALACLRTVGIREIGQLGGADELIQRPEFSKGSELYEIVCALNRHGLSLPASGRQRVPGDREREIFRLRVVEGLTLPEVAKRIGGVRSERVRQLLSFYFGLKGKPPAAKERKRAATARRLAVDLEAAQAVRAELIAGWRTGLSPRDLAGRFDVYVVSVKVVIRTAVTEADLKARTRALANQCHREERRPHHDRLASMRDRTIGETRTRERLLSMQLAKGD